MALFAFKERGASKMNMFGFLENYKPYKQLKNAFDNGKTPISVAGIVESAMPHLIASLSEGKTAFVIVYSELEAGLMAKELQLYTDRVFVYPDKEYVYYNIDAKNHEREFTRLKILDEIKNGGIFMLPISACNSYTLPYEKLKKLSFDIKISEVYDIEELAERLNLMGYTREDMTEAVGQYSIRGGILDIFPPCAELPFRIEFFDNEVDSVRVFDSVSQRSLENADECRIIPASELCMTKAEKTKIIEFAEKTKKSKKCGTELLETLDADLERLTENMLFPAVDKYIGVMYENIPTVCDYIFDDSAVFIIEPKRINERAKTLEWEQGERYSEFSQKGILPPKSANLFKDFKEIYTVFSKSKMISLNLLTHTSINFTYNEIVDFVTRNTISFHGKVDYLYDDLAAWKKENATVVIAASGKSRCENLVGTLTQNGFNSRFIEPDGEFEKGETVVITAQSKKGFEYPECGFVFIAEQDIFNSDKKRRERKIDNAKRLKSYTDINVGDLVVHRAHGIGEYCGIKKMTVGGITKDYLHIKYQGSDVLYVPVDQMELLYKYVGNSDKTIKLNKLGGTEWTNTKKKVKASTKDMAKQLVALYAERERTRGFAFSEDTAWQREFEDTFGYDETDDQLRSIEEVKKDMENIKPMDRLLCGDVGYGKTEIALRAAFKAVCDSKQVAYLCPTTILAMQHFETFKRRMTDFPIRVAMLSRFCSAKEQKEILKKLKTGEIDVLIGTHRILQKDVVYKDIGLLIIDEEQRFGVADKEKIKEMKKNIDVLSMTATPIPRTLHMAMISVRDMSLLETPPGNRYPVETFVLEHNPIVLADAMKKELARGGQVFYLYNRVKGIYTVAETIKKLIPEARVAVGHGKMKEDELEDIMYDMVNGDTDILVCTTIIETGLDIPNANTIIIENADKMGLSQLYQLRGRVGRSNRSAYAYMTYKRDGVLSETAQKRLSAIREFTEFGSGFKIAMRDLEIRGAGDILGAQQHGHMDAVGYDMYCKILAESVREERGTEDVENFDVSVDISIDAYIPEKYIRNVNQRIDVYKQIAAITSVEDKSDVTDELIDRFGDVPKPVMNLIEIAYIKTVASECGVCEISEKPKGFVFKFDNSAFKPDRVMELVKKCPKNIKLSNTDMPEFTYFDREIKNKLGVIKTVLYAMSDGVKDE